MRVEPGRFITLEGGEGSGKSTQIRLLRHAFEAAGIPILATREPGGATGAERIRSLLVNGDVERWSPATEALLHYAARRDHVERTIQPALDSGRWVLCDRFADSTMAYQGYGHGLGPDFIERLHELALGDFRPNLTLVLDLPVETGLGRAEARRAGEDRYERMEIEFHHRLRDGFHAIAEAEPERCVVVDADRTVNAIQDDLQRIIRERFHIAV